MAWLLEEAGQDGEAITFYLRAAEAGDIFAFENAAELLETAGEAREATRLRRYGIEPGGQIANPWQASVQAQVTSGNGPSVRRSTTGQGSPN